MNQSTHIIDPDGEVTITLRSANSPFAEAIDGTVSVPGIETLPESSSKSLKIKRKGKKK